MLARTRFAALALPHLTAIYRPARQLAGPDKADDLTRETFLNAWAHFDQFDPSTNCRAWLCRILRNTWVSQWRKTRLELPVADIEDVAAEPWYDWERQRTDSDLSADMQWALDQLPEVYRWSVLLADVEEFTYHEIAATMECPVGTVMSRMSRGRRMLGRLLSERRRAEPPAMRIVVGER
jgi:RNA polymerase sigma-70 factor (ECF subfamily)